MQAAVSLAEESVECLQASSMMGPVVLLDKAHRNAKRSERNPADRGSEREAAAAMGVGSRENASSSGLLLTVSVSVGQYMTLGTAQSAWAYEGPK